MTKNILVNGAFGRMGQMICAALSHNTEFSLVAKTGRLDDLHQAIITTKPHIVIDFTDADGIWETTQKIMQHRVSPIIGTSGLKKDQIDYLIEHYQAKKQGGLIIPNFSLGAVLQMRCAEDIARYFTKAEIIETHHEKKIDAPSGTALRTAERIHNISACNPPIHSIRLPGFVAEQSVVFGASAETLRVTHQVLNREAYLPGLILACQKVTTLNQLYYGLEFCLDE